MDFIVFFAARGQHQHGRGTIFPNFAYGRKAVQLRHHHVHDDDVKIIRMFAADAHGLHTVRRLTHGMALELRIFPD